MHKICSYVAHKTLVLRIFPEENISSKRHFGNLSLRDMGHILFVDSDIVKKTEWEWQSFLKKEGKFIFHCITKA
jgi:hypothetical protein